LIAILILVGAWLEKYILVIPSLQEKRMREIGQLEGMPGFNLGPYEVFITVGVLSIFLLSLIYFFKQTPLLPISDVHLSQGEINGCTSINR